MLGPLLLWRRTRRAALAGAVLLHVAIGVTALVTAAIAVGEPRDGIWLVTWLGEAVIALDGTTLDHARIDAAQVALAAEIPDPVG